MSFSQRAIALTLISAAAWAFVLYPLSSGPYALAVKKGWIPWKVATEVTDDYYRPLFWLSRKSPAFESPYRTYLKWWGEDRMLTTQFREYRRRHP